MLAVTLYEPWASLVALGWKRIETRSWSTKYRGPLAIHASKNGYWVAETGTILKSAGKTPEEIREFRKLAEPWPLGKILAVATLAGCEETQDIVRQGLSVQEVALGNYSPGRWGWKLEDLRRLPNPVACKGALGLWTVPQEIESALAEVPA